MEKTLTVVFDGRALYPEGPLDLLPNTRYTITIQDILPPSPAGNLWDTLQLLTGTLEAPADWAGEHDHYLYGTPKHQ
jgi:hypothetical protein